LAEKLLEAGNAKQSVNYFVESNLSLKAVYEKFVKKKYFDELVDYLKLKKKVSTKNLIRPINLLIVKIRLDEIRLLNKNPALGVNVTSWKIKSKLKSELINV